MTLEELKELTGQLISRAKTKQAIDEILKWAQENHREQLKKDATILMGDLNSLDRNKMLGLLPNSEINSKQNNINYGVLGLLDITNENTPSQDNIKEDFLSGKTKILMLTANPANTTRLNLDKEHSVIIRKLQQKPEFFNIILKNAVSRDEFREFTQQGEPDILHFSGHGEKGKYAGIVVQNDDKNGEDLIPVSGLKALFKYFKKRFKIKVVLLNACHTQEQAAAISEYVDYVIGTNVAIGDKAASAFSSGFYFQLAEDYSGDIESAFESGRTAAVMEGAEEQNFVIYKHGKLIVID